MCTVSGTALTLVAAGTCTITANQAGNTGYAAAAAVSRTFTVAAAPIVTSAVNGKAIYLANCATSSCHYTSPSIGINKILNGANNPGKILSAINNVSQMSPLRGQISTQQANDLAAYLATPNI